MPSRASIATIGFSDGETLTVGNYTMGAAINLAGTLTLPAADGSNDEVNIKVGGALGAGAGFKMEEEQGGGAPAKVIWYIGGAASIGADCTIIGILKTDGAANIGAGSTVTGAIEAVGAIGMGAGSTMAGSLTSGAAVTVGANSTVTGAISAIGAVSLGANAECNSVDGGGALALGANVILTPGTYDAAAVNVAGNLVLDTQDNDGVEWTFTIRGALVTAAGSKMSFVGVGATTAVVKWTVDGAVTLGADSFVIGDVTHVGGVTWGANAVIDGDVNVAGE
jgi:hypothetical protein